jgi:predicted permease
VVNEQQLIVFAVGISVVTGLLFGLAPVAQIFRADLVTAIKSNAAVSSGRKWFEIRKLLVVAQVALSVILLLGAGLLVRTLVLVGQEDVGFESRGLTLATVYMPMDRSSDEVEALAAYEDLLERTRRISGVESVSLVQMIPLSGFSRTVGATLPHRPEEEQINYNIIGPGYFETMKIPLLQGREFDDRDRHGSPGVAIVNQAAAAHLWPDRDFIGQNIQIRRRVGIDRSTSYEVVGIAADSRYQRIVDPIRPQVYLSFHQEFRPRLTFVVRSSTPIASELREGFRQQYPDMAIIDLVPFAEQMRRALTDQRMNADIALGFGFLGLLLAATGIFSVMSYVVSRRHREFGIRMAIGATSSDMSKQILGEAGRLIGVGVVAGLFSALALAKILASILYGVSSHDTLTFVVVPLVLALIGLLAAFVPARRASRVDPIIALREE